MPNDPESDMIFVIGMFSFLFFFFVALFCVAIFIYHGQLPPDSSSGPVMATFLLCAILGSYAFLAVGNQILSLLRRLRDIPPDKGVRPENLVIQLGLCIGIIFLCVVPGTINIFLFTVAAGLAGKEYIVPLIAIFMILPMAEILGCNYLLSFLDRGEWYPHLRYVIKMRLYRKV